MIKIYSSEIASQSILKRVPLDDMGVSQQILARIEELFGDALIPEQAVQRILFEIRTEGDQALRRWSAKLDGLDTSDFLVTQEEIKDSQRKISKVELSALKESADRIRRFYMKQPVSSWIVQGEDGTLGQLVRPIQRVGIYVPGGTAPLPSSVLMSAVPAQVAKVKEVVLVVPPEKATGKIAPIILAAASILGIKEIYALGGAQAIGALAFGTESIPAVDKIFGPGNLFVTLAKRQVFGTVGIDGLAGPTETMILADETANPDWVAADLLAQAEHDVLASAILVSTSKELAEAVQEAVDRRIKVLPRADIIRESLAMNSGIIVTATIEEAIRIVNEYAPEHLCLSLREPYKVSEQIFCAGGIFIGEYSCEVLGDYVAGPSHVMPTSGTARFSSPLNVLDFVNLISMVALDGEAAKDLAKSAAIIARAEKLEAHAQAALIRVGDSPENQ